MVPCLLLHCREELLETKLKFKVVKIKNILEENFGLKRPLGLMCKVCYMQKVDISEIFPQQVHQAQGISEEANVTY